MDDEPERMDPRCDAGGRGYMLWMEYCSDGEYIRATDYDEFVQTRTRGVDEMADMIEASPTPTAAELMARIQTGEEE